jgi:RNA-binding protein
MPPSPPKLSGSALRKLRALGHALVPVVAVGKDGVTDALIAAADSAIATHELVKVKIQREAPVDQHEAGIELAARTGSALAQVIGRTLLLYRRHPKKPKIDLSVARKAPKARPSPPKVVESAVESGGIEDEDPEENP